MELIQLGQKIKQARKNKGLSQEKFAELVGIHEKQISKIETGKSFPTRKNLEKILNVLEVHNEFEFNLDEKTTIPEKIQLLKIINSANDEEIKLYAAILKKISKFINN